MREQLERDGPAGMFLGWGVSPHAPYTVRWDALRRIGQLSASARVPLAMHVAESPDELELLRDHRGPLRELLEQLEVWDPSAFPPGLQLLDRLQVLATAHRALAIHGNYLTAEELRFLAEHRDRIALVYCPRTHAFFGHDNYPLAEILRAGLRLAIGTDSRASSPDLSVLAELRQAARSHPELPPEAILRMGTLSGACALGLGDRVGSLRAGKQADLVAVSLPESASDDPYAFLHDPACRVVRVYKSGRLVFTAGSC